MNRMRCLIGLALLCVVAPGCPSHHDEDADTRDVNTAARGSKSAKAAPVAGRSTEDVVRAFYPAVLGNFYSTGIKRHDEAGENVSVGYNYLPEGVTQIAFNAYFYPGDKDAKSLDDAWKSAVGDVKSSHRGVKIGAGDPVVTQQSGETIQGRKATYRYDGVFGTGQRQPLVEELYLFRKGDRLVKYLITYPAADAAEAQQRLSGFVSAFPWPSSI